MTQSTDIREPRVAICNQMLTFVLGAGNYGVDILRVLEIRGWSPVTRIPQSPPHVLGVLNLRGTIVPIVDLRRRFELESVEYNALTVIIVVSVQTAGARREVGMVVDAVSEVVDVRSDDLRSAPDLGARQATDHLHGLIPIGERMVVLLDVDRLIEAQLPPEMSPAAAAA